MKCRGINRKDSSLATDFGKFGFQSLLQRLGVLEKNRWGNAWVHDFILCSGLIDFSDCQCCFLRISLADCQLFLSPAFLGTLQNYSDQEVDDLGGGGGVTWIISNGYSSPQSHWLQRIQWKGQGCPQSLPSGPWRLSWRPSWSGRRWGCWWRLSTHVGCSLAPSLKYRLNFDFGKIFAFAPFK